MKTRHILSIAAYLLMVGLMASCSEELPVAEPTQPGAPNTLSLTLNCSQVVKTRLTEAGVDAFNENDIHRLDIFLYPNSADFDTQATWSTTINNIDATSTHTVSISLEETTIDALFGDAGTTCKVYVIANRPDGTALDAAKTSVNELKAMKIVSPATVNGTYQTDFDDNQAEADFVMDSDFTDNSDGNDVVTLDRDARTLSGIVPLYRAASKIALIVKSIATVEEKDENGVVRERWEPNIDLSNTYTGIYAKFHNGVSATTIDNSVAPYTVQDDDYFSLTDDKDSRLYMKSEDGVGYVHPLPFYSYSSAWMDDPDNESYFVLSVRWKHTLYDADGTDISATAGGEYKSCYYQIPVNVINQNFVRNTYYKVMLDISILGSFVEELPTELTPSYMILDWTTETVSAELKDFRFLMAEQTSYTIYNQEELKIPYVTSHATTIVDIKFKKENIKEPKESTSEGTWETIEANDDKYYQALTWDDKTGEITFKNDLINDFTKSDFDFTPYRLTFTIRHTDRADYYETITITQYPAIYGETETNWDYHNNYQGTGTDGDNGFTFVNGYQGEDSGDYSFFGTVNGLSGNSSSSPNRYVFTVTSVKGTSYVIGDPRENDVTYDGTEANTTWCEAPVLYNGTVYPDGTTTPVESERTIKYYYGTEVTSDLFTTRTTTDAIYADDAAAEAAEKTINMIAPKFRVASGYAVLGTGGQGMNVLENLKKRCASYQEDGYPAGRWRLPTRAEFQFMISQVNQNNLPQIYIKNTAYWCAHGVGTYQSDGSIKMNYVARDGSGHSTRCVYDEWYWEDKLETSALKDEFTWGDQPR